MTGSTTQGSGTQDAAPPDEPLTPGAQRILEVASELFYWRGLTAVGVDTIAAESGVTKRTLYDRFGSKDQLIFAYLRTRDRQWQDLVTDRLEDQPAGSIARVLTPFDVLPQWLVRGGRGCTFINAYAELPDPQHPGHQVVVGSKQWLVALFDRLVGEAGVADHTGLARQLFSLHEGAIVAFSMLEDDDAVAGARDAAETLLVTATETLT